MHCGTWTGWRTCCGGRTGGLIGDRPTLFAEDHRVRRLLPAIRFPDWTRELDRHGVTFCSQPKVQVQVGREEINPGIDQHLDRTVR